MYLHFIHKYTLNCGRVAHLLHQIRGDELHFIRVQLQILLHFQYLPQQLESGQI